MIKQLTSYTATALAGMAATAALHGIPAHKGAVPHTPTVQSSVAPRQIVAPGRVEPVSEEIKVGAELPGRLQTVLVDEGNRVQRGQTLAVLQNADYQARLAAAEAALQQRQADLTRLINGSRPQERRQAEATTRQAAAQLANTRAEMVRRQGLFREEVVTREEKERAEREYQVALAGYQAEQQHQSLVANATRPEDLARARADVAAARAQVAEAQAMLQKTIIRSPIAGVVLRRYLKAGESVGDPPTLSVVSVANVATLRVRAEIDEVDVARLHLGQLAYVRADAYGSRHFSGRVVRIGQELGRKNVRTDEPGERVDTKVLETLIQLDSGTRLPVGLRVDVYIDGVGQTIRG